MKALGNRELTSLGYFQTFTDLAPEFHLPFYATGAVDWFGLRIKELPRRRQDVIGLPATILGWGGAAVILTPRPDASGAMEAPDKFYGTRLTGVFQKMTSFKDIPGILNELIQATLSEEVEDLVREHNVVLIRGITYAEDEETMGSIRPQIMQGHKDERGEQFFVSHPDSRKYKEEGALSTHFFPSDNLCKVIEDLVEKQCIRLLPVMGGTLLTYTESRFHEEMNDPEKVRLISNLPEGWWNGLSTPVEMRLWEFIQGNGQRQQQETGCQQQLHQQSQAAAVAEAASVAAAAAAAAAAAEQQSKQQGQQQQQQQ